MSYQSFGGTTMNLSDIRLGLLGGTKKSTTALKQDEVKVLPKQVEDFSVYGTKLWKGQRGGGYTEVSGVKGTYTPAGEIKDLIFFEDVIEFKMSVEQNKIVMLNRGDYSRDPDTEVRVNEIEPGMAVNDYIVSVEEVITEMLIVKLGGEKAFAEYLSDIKEAISDKIKGIEQGKVSLRDKFKSKGVALKDKKEAVEVKSEGLEALLNADVQEVQSVEDIMSAFNIDL